MITDFINSLALVVSLVTAGSVFLHDTRIDRAAVAAAALPTTTVVYEDASSKLLNLGGEAHTHIERASVAMHDLAFGNPRIPPKDDGKKHLLQKRVPRGHHAFDNYNLPIV